MFAVFSAVPAALPADIWFEFSTLSMHHDRGDRDRPTPVGLAHDPLHPQ